MKTLAWCFAFWLAMLHSSGLLTAQILVENFEFSGDLSSNGWTAHSSAGTNPIATTTGLSIVGYTGSGIGNAAGLFENGEDLHRLFAAATSGTVYVSCMVRVYDVPTSAASAYFLHLSQSPFNAIAFRGKVFAQRNGTGGLQFGVSVADNAPALTGVVYSLGSDYVLVLKYQIVSGASNDQVSLYVFDGSVPELEPPAATLGPLTEPASADLANVGSVALRQFNASQRIVVDGIRVAASWAELSLPVELISFKSLVHGRHIELVWQTASEKNNSGFFVERKNVEGKWSQLGFVKGHGTSNTQNDYRYPDAVTAGGKYIYRLKQVDNDGRFEYSEEVEAAVALQPADYTLAQNYPNPFNPTTNIRFALKTTQHVVVKVYSLIGQEVATLFEGLAIGGQMTNVQFDALRLTSGIYFYRLESEERTEVKRMMLIK